MSSFREILPNCVPSILTKMTLDLGFVILIASSLSFLGLGVQPPTPDLGSMVADGAKYLPDSWWLTVFPGLAILVAVFGFNLIGDALREDIGGRAMNAPTLLIRDLKLGFRTYAGVLDVLHGIALHIGKGERVALVGESGSGSRSRARIILGLIQSLRSAACLRPGRVRRGRDLAKLSERAAARAARHENVDDLSGPDLVAQPGLHDRHPVPRGAALRGSPNITKCGGAPTRADGGARRRSRFPNRSACWIPIRSSSPAA